MKYSQILKPLLFKNRKAVLGLDTVKLVILTLLTLAIVAIAALLALTSIRDASLFTAGSTEATVTNDTIANISSGIGKFFKQVPVFFTLLAVVVLILIIAIVIVAVSRFGGGARGESL